MYNDKKILAIIPARGGSKGLPGKNIRPLLGKPLIGWTIEQAKASKYIDNIYISTDCEYIAGCAEKFGVKVPELRPETLSTDNSPSSDFIVYTIDLMTKKDCIFDYIILLEPTSPLRETSDIDEAIEQLANNPIAESIVGVTKLENTHPSFLVKVENNYLKPYLSELSVTRRQDLDLLYFFEGSVYISKVESFLKRRTFYHEKTIPYYVSKWKSFEIDDMEDWFIVESILIRKLKGI